MQSNNRRNFLKKASFTGASAMAFSAIVAKVQAINNAQVTFNDQSILLTQKDQALRITGTFLDEISHDIPHQNWGDKNGT